MSVTHEYHDNPTDQQMVPPPEMSAEEKGAVNYGILCRIMVEGSAVAMREVFDTIHPPISLGNRLQKAQAIKTLHRLRHQGVITKPQWEYLYPSNSILRPSSTNFDAPILQLLLRTVCHLSPPYPNGWDGIPLQADLGIAADLTRFDYFRKMLLSTSSLTDREMDVYYSQILGVLTRFSGPIAKIKIERVAREAVCDSQGKLSVEALQSWEQQNLRMSAAANLPHDGTSVDLSTGFKLPSIETSRDNMAKLYPYIINEDGQTSQMLQVPTTGRMASDGKRSRGSGSRSPVPAGFLKQDRKILLQFHKLLTDNIRSDAVLPKLVKAGVFSHEERNSINLATRNVDRVKSLLRILPEKTGFAFGAFCEAMKYKYTSIYDQLMKAKQLAMERPDEMSELSDALRSSYTSLMSRYHPIPWHPKAVVDVRDFYVPLYICDQQGREWTPATLVQGYTKVKPGMGHRILLEGEGGVGKSTVMRYLAAEWANGSKPLTDRYRLVFRLDVKLIKNGLIEAILEYDLPPEFEKTPAELRHLIQVCQKEVMFFLDGLEDLAPKVTEEITELIQGKLFPESSLIVTVNSTYVTPSLLKSFDTKLVVMGLMANMQEELVLRYNDITQTQTETFAILLAKIIQEYDTSVRVLSLNPLFCLCMCLVCEVGSTLEVTTPTSLLQETLTALKQLYCQRNKLEVSKTETQEFLETLTQDLGEMAWRCMHENGSFFQYDQVGMSPEDNPMFALGILQQHVSPALPTLQQCFFPNRVFQDFMVARVLSHLEADDFREYLDSLVYDSYYSNVTKYFCGLHRLESDAQQTSDLIRGLAAKNRGRWRSVKNRDDLEDDHEEKDGDSTTGSEGRMCDFKLSLECIYECEGQDYVTNVIADSLPMKLASHNKAISTAGLVRGLGYILRLDSSPVTTLDLRLDHFAHYHVYPFVVLADAIERSKNLSELKLLWLNPEFLALFLANIFSEKTNLRILHCQDKTKTSTEDKISAGAWANLRAACQKMDTLSRFIFTHCSNKAIVSSILRNLPYSVEELDLSHCTMDLVSTQDLGSRVEKSQSLSNLNLTSSTICHPDFSYISSGLKLSRSLQELNLSHTNLDVNDIVVLSEALKFNHNLTQLDISGNKLTDTACQALAHALSINQKVRQVTLVDATMSMEGKHVLRKMTHGDVHLVGMDSSQFPSRALNLDLPFQTSNLGHSLTVK